VNAEAGTTRDSLEETLLVHGVPVRLVDTAGLRDAASAVEREGVSRAKDLASRADLVIRCVCAGSPAPEVPERELLLFTKSDLAPGFSPPPGALAASALSGEGLDALRGEIARRVGADEASMPEVAVSERHAALLREAASEIDGARELWRAGGEDAAVPAASRLRAATEALDRITGRVWNDDLLDAVFGRFCIGK